MKVIDLLPKMNDAQAIVAQGDVSEAYSHNWWEKMVMEAVQFTSVEEYKTHRQSTDESVIDMMIGEGSTKKHKTKAGKYIIGSIFQTHKAYNNYRSNKSIICKAIDMGVPLVTQDFVARPKTEVQKDIKESTHITPKSPYAIALKATRQLQEVWGSLSSEERQSLPVELL